MKEIDFLPEWYKSGRRREVSYRTQYIALSAIFVIMMIWSFVAGRSISKAEAELALTKAQAAASGSTSLEFTEIQSQLAQLKKESQYKEQVGSEIDVAGVLAELSFLIDEKIVLQKVEFIAEKFVPGASGGSTIRVTGRSFPGKGTNAGDANVRFRVVMRGIASDASDVAELVCRLEDSSYFQHVYPSFSRNTHISRMKGSVKAQVSEFEIRCYLANYIEG